LAMRMMLCLLLLALLRAVDPVVAATHLEKLALRQQLAVFKSKRPRPWLRQRDRLFWVLLARIWPDWRDALVIVKPATVIGWHRRGFKVLWTWKSRPRRAGRPRLPNGIRELIRRMCRDNPLWGAPRIHGELLKLGIDVSEASVGRYMPRNRKPPSQTWRTFLENHADCLASMDLFVVPTAAFRLLYGFVILRHNRRRIVHVGVTKSPTAVWIAQQIIEAFPRDTAPRYLIRDRDGAYGPIVRERLAAMAVTEVLTAPRSPWQSPYVERVIGSIRREVLNHVIVLNEAHLRRILASYLDYDHGARTHLSLDKDAPDGRPVQPPDAGNIVAFPEIGGLHRRYERLAA
jgi:putative transposase